jgi:hypothetical protein
MARDGEMMTHYDFCPKCQGLRKTSLSIFLKNTPGPDGEPAEALVIHYHCETCLSFIRSAERDEAEVFEYAKYPAYLP